MTGRYERFWNQYDEVRLRQGDRFTVWPPTAQRHNDEAPKFVYETGKVLCHTGAAEMVRDRMGISAETSAPLPGELTGITLPGTTDIYEWVRAANAGCAPGQPCVTPNYLVSITPVNMCPANEPLPVGPDAQPWPPRAAQPAAGGREVTIQVVDTGIFLDALNDPAYQQRHPWLAGIVRPPEVSLPDIARNPFERPGEGLPILATGGAAAGDLMDTDTVFKNPVYDERTRRIKEYAGHGTFIAGVIGCAAPNARIRMHNALQDGGALLETDLGTKLLEVVHTYGWPDIISLSAGCPTMDGAELKGLKLFMAELAKQETLLIAAAGNDGERDAPFYPAAYAQSYPGVVVSVGALRRDAPGRACFTNYGRSVTVYARGERHVNAFPVGRYAYHHPTEEHCHNYPLPDYPDGLYPCCTCLDNHDGPASFDGMAEWSGTSFATPLVAAKVAAYMWEHPDISPRQAFEDVFNKQTQSIPNASDADGELLHAFL